MTMARGIRQFALILKKNWILIGRQKGLTVLEILLPVAFAILLVVIRRQVDSVEYPAGREWPRFTADGIILQPTAANPFSSSGRWVLAHTPASNPIATRIMANLKSKLNFDSLELSFEGESELEEFMTPDNMTSTDIWGAVVFKNLPAENESFPHSIVYSIRPQAQLSLKGIEKADEWMTDILFPFYDLPGPRQEDSPSGGKPYYKEKGFLAVQYHLDMSITEEVARGSNVSDIAVALQRFPYPAYVDDRFILVIQNQLPFFIMLSFIVIAPNIVKDIVLEKERRLKEFMKMMGLRGWTHWSAWFVKYTLMTAVSCILMTIIYCRPLGRGEAVFNASQPTLIFVFLQLYCISNVAFCFMVSCFFQKASTAGAAGGILYFLSYVPYYFVNPWYGRMTLSQKIVACLLSNTAMSMGAMQVARAEGTGAGAQWSNIDQAVSSDDRFTLSHVMIMLVADACLYLIIVWYMDNVKPGEYGVPRPWYFPFTRKYWFPKEKIGPFEYVDSGTPSSAISTLFEKEPSNLKPGIRIANLRKVFKRGKTKKVAVSGISMNMYEGQITALLGHNGAGKTTTMSMLTGFLPPTSGTAYINDMDINIDIDRIRESVGLCPQHNVLFDLLTVWEHLTFFAQLKGCSSSEAKQEAEKMLEVLHLQDKKHALSRSLSGGMKRKLCVGMALIYNSKTVILDEPTSGMDPEARRQMWDILQSQRQGRTMILSTHFMDEADLLGDRIAIMSDGELQCCGSSLFLKNKYGVGYHLVMIKKPNCAISKITAIIKAFLPSAELESNLAAELSYILPQEGSSQFEGLFESLERQQDELGIASFGASVTTMEEVFLKVGEAAAKAQQDNAPGVVNAAYDDDAILPVALDLHETMRKLEKKTGLGLYLQQFRGLLVKRMIHTWRSKLVTIVQLLVPVFFTALAAVIIETIPGYQDPPAMSLSLQPYAMKQIVAHSINSTSSSDAAVSLVGHFTGAVKQSVASVQTVDVNALSSYADDPSIIQYIKDIGETNIDAYLRRYMIAASVNEEGNTITGLFNNEAFHTVAVALNSVTNAVMRKVTSLNHTILATNHPLPKVRDGRLKEDLEQALTLGLILTLNNMFGMAFLIATFAVFVIRERVTSSKHIQHVSGVGVVTYWLSTFCWDLANYCIPAILLIIIYPIIDFEAFVHANNLGYVALLLMFYAFGALPMTYLLSHIFDQPSTGYTWTVNIDFITGLAASLTVFILRIPALALMSEANTCAWVFYIFLPHFCYGNGLQDLFVNYQYQKVCGSQAVDWTTFCAMLTSFNGSNPCCPENCIRGGFCAPYQENYLAWEYPGIGRSLVFLTLHCVVFFLLIFLVESSAWNSIKQNITERINTRPPPEPEVIASNVRRESLLLSSTALRKDNDDVAKEHSRLLEQQQHSDVLVMLELRKTYGHLVAVDGLSVGIPQGECFGLLGVNGAGKTSTFKMLTGDLHITSGDAYLNGYSVKNDIKKVQKQVGYCPQFDALIEQMTVKETLVLYSRLRGVEESQIDSAVSHTIKAVLLDDHVNKYAGDLSGGNKRKLSTAIAIIGNPAVVFLDEPSTGIDPAARRHLWNTLAQCRARGITLVLTSHSMEECEALCTRLAIMVNGQFKCLGTPQYLKGKFSEGYTLLAKVSGMDDADIDTHTENLVAFIEQTFPGSVLKDLHQGYVHYQVHTAGLSWARVFGTMERAKAEYHIEDYSVSQTTLEQVFLSFARAQRPPLEGTLGCGAKCGNCCRFFCCCCCSAK